MSMPARPVPRPAPARLARLRRATVPAVLLVGLAGCSLSQDDQDAADALAAVVGGEEATDSERDRAGCLAEKWVGEAGRTALVEEGLLTEEGDAEPGAVRRVVAGEQPVPAPVAEAYAASWVACTDHDLIALDEEERLPEASAEDLDEYADCLKEVDDDVWGDALVARLTGKDDGAVRALAGELATCRTDLERRAAR